MSDFRELASYRGWIVNWDSKSGKMFAKRDGSWADSHHFHERPRDAGTAMAIAKAWIDHG